MAADVDGTQIGHYVVHYEDGATASIPIVYGQDVRDWWATEDRIPVTRARVAWTGTNPPIERFKTVLRLYLAVWENPHPEKKIARLDFCSACKTPCAPFSVAITVEEPASLPAEPPQPPLRTPRKPNRRSRPDRCPARRGLSL